jgi:hypothetical protein
MSSNVELEQGFDIKSLDIEIQNLYVNARVEYKEIIASIFNTKDGIETNTQNRPLPPYAKGTLDKPFMQGGMPLLKKPRKLVNAILSGNYRFIEIEGGKRGSKDIYGLFGWSKYLMVCPEKLHLALGSSLEHVLRTVLMSNGFGLYFLIPHGIFIRETINGAQRGVYKFLDNYGIEKQILFYGNEKENDKNKYQGFTLGSVYVNEALNQHPNGISEADDRIASTRQPLIITTQNPQGESNAFYLEVEKPRLTSIANIEQMEYVRDNYKDKFYSLKNQLLKDCDNEKRKIIKDYLNNFSVSKIEELPKNYQIILNETLLNLNYEFDKIIRNYSVEDFASDYIFREKSERLDYLNYTTKKHEIQDEFANNPDFDIDTELNALKGSFFGKYKNKYLLQKSMALVSEFERGGDNPNHIYNAYNFYYAHFNVDDNLYMTEMQRNNYKNSRAVGTASHDQDIIGLRRSAEGAIYDTFSSANIFTGDIKKFDWTGKVRAIVIDPGFNHPTGITDWAVDLNIGKAWCLQERKIDFKVEYIGEKSLDTIYYEFLKTVRGAKDRANPEFVIIDPSKPELIEYIQNFGFSVYAANNQNWTTDRKDKEISEQITARELRGIPLVQTAFARLKIMVHESCVLLIKEIGSYSYVQNDKDSTDKLPKLYDDLVVTVKYLVNTLGIRPSMWENDDGESENDQRKVLGNEEGENSQWNVENALSNIFEKDQTDNGFFGQGQEDDNDFFSDGSDGFFS